jgi:hypothetical protein
VSEDRFLDLAGRFLEGAAGAAELEELDRIVRDDAEARRTLALLVDQHATLRRLHARPSVGRRAAAESSPALRAPAAFLLRLPRFARRVLAAAAVLLVCLAAWFAFRGGNTPKPVPAAPMPGPIVANVPKAPAPKPAPAPAAAPRVEPVQPVTLEPERPATPPLAPAADAVPPAPPVVVAPAPIPAPEDPVVSDSAPDAAPDSFAPVPVPVSAPALTSGTPPAPAAPTVAEVPLASIERVAGTVRLVVPGAAGPFPATAGRDIPRGCGLSTGSGESLAVVKYADGTRLEVGPETTVALFSRWTPRGAAAPAPASGGKYLLLQQGTLAAEVAAQPPGLPMILGTPLADVQVLGTRFTLAAVPEATRVEVKQGRVVLVRRADRAAAEIRAGQCGEAPRNGPPSVRPAPPPEVRIASVVTVRFGPAGTAVPAGTLLDSGDEPDAARTYGWQGSKERRKSMIGIYLERQWVTKGREPRAFAKAADPMRSSGVSAGSAFHAETWEMPLANGRYIVTVCAGDPDAPQGPHHVIIEGQAVIAATPTAAGAFAEKADVPVTVRDGKLTVAVGGHRAGPGPNRDRPGETTLVSLVIKKIAE